MTYCTKIQTCSTFQKRRKENDTIVLATIRNISIQSFSCIYSQSPQQSRHRPLHHSATRCIFAAASVVIAPIWDFQVQATVAVGEKSANECSKKHFVFFWRSCHASSSSAAIKSCRYHSPHHHVSRQQPQHVYRQFLFNPSSRHACGSEAEIYRPFSNIAAQFVSRHDLCTPSSYPLSPTCSPARPHLFLCCFRLETFCSISKFWFIQACTHPLSPGRARRSMPIPRCVRCRRRR